MSKLWTNTNVKYVSGTKTVGRFGEAISHGQACYLKSDGLWYLVNPVSSDTPSPSNAIAVCLAGGAIGQEGLFMSTEGGLIEYGAGVFAQGEIIVADNTPGGLANESDLTQGTSEVQSLSLSGATGGNLFLTFDGLVTSNIAFDATAATVQSALEALTNIGAGNVACTGGPLNTAAISIAFQNDLANTDVSQMTATSVDLTGSPTLTVSTTTPGVNGDFLIILGYAHTSSYLLIDPLHTNRRS